MLHPYRPPGWAIVVLLMLAVGAGPALAGASSGSTFTVKNNSDIKSSVLAFDKNDAVQMVPSQAEYMDPNSSKSLKCGAAGGCLIRVMYCTYGKPYSNMTSCFPPSDFCCSRQEESKVVVNGGCVQLMNGFNGLLSTGSC